MPRSNGTQHIARLEEQAPDRCEICDCALPNFANRLEHIETTGHCACPDIDCWGYIPPGFVTQHYSAMHTSDNWNEHQISGGDASTLRKALPWVRDAYQKRFQDVIDVEQWLGLDKHKGMSEAVRAFRMKLEEFDKESDAKKLAERKEFVRKKNEEQTKPDEGK